MCSQISKHQGIKHTELSLVTEKAGTKGGYSLVTFVLKPQTAPAPYLESVCLGRSIRLSSRDPYLQAVFSVNIEPTLVSYMESVWM